MSPTTVPIILRKHVFVSKQETFDIAKSSPILSKNSYTVFLGDVLFDSFYPAARGLNTAITLADLFATCIKPNGSFDEEHYSKSVTTLLDSVEKSNEEEIQLRLNHIESLSQIRSHL